MIDIFYTGHGKRWPTAETNQTNSFEPVFISQFVDIRRFLWQGFLDTLGKFEIGLFAMMVRKLKKNRRITCFNGISILSNNIRIVTFSGIFTIYRWLRNFAKYTVHSTSTVKNTTDFSNRLVENVVTRHGFPWLFSRDCIDRIYFFVA